MNILMGVLAGMILGISLYWVLETIQEKLSDEQE